MGSTLAEKKARLQKIMDAQNKSAGSIVVGYGKDIAKPLEFLPTPSQEFNLITGGGFPKGRITEIFGPQSSGKTSLVEETIGEDMARDPDAIWVWGETEEPFDMDYASLIHGIDPDRLILVEQDESGGETLIDRMEPYLRSGDIKGFAINSVAGLTPKKELSESMEKQDIALQARMMSKLMRKWTAIIAKRGLYAIFINQLRTNVGVMFGDPNVTTGGRALAYYSSLRVGLNKLVFDDAEKKIYPDDEFMKIGVRIAKNRCVYDNPYKKGQYVIKYGEGVDKVSEIISKAPEAGILRNSGAWYYYEKEDGELIVAKKAVVDGKPKLNVPLKWNGRAELRKFLIENDWFVTQLREELAGAVSRGQLLPTYQSEEEMEEIRKLEAIEAEIAAEEEKMAKDDNKSKSKSKGKSKKKKAED
jgi:recombination protein RecA